MKKYRWLVATVLAMLVFACASQKEPAQQAVAKIEAALSAVHESAEKFAPDTVHGIDAQVATLKQSLAKGDYQAVIAAAPAISASIASLKQDVDAKQSAADAELAKVKQQWRNLNAEVPKMVTDLKTQVETMSKTKKYPKGLNKASFATASAAVASLDQMWTDATNSVANSDNYADGVAKAQAVKDKATELMHTLGIKTGS